MAHEFQLPTTEGDIDKVLPFSLVLFLHTRNKKNTKTTFHRLFTEFKEDVLFLPVLDKLLENKVIGFDGNIVKLLKKPEIPKPHIPDPNAPVFEYDDRYFEQCNYTRKELYDLQRLILTMKTSKNIGEDVLKNTKFNEQEINTCLSKFYEKKLVKREKIGLDGEKVIFRYYYFQ